MAQRIVKPETITVPANTERVSCDGKVEGRPESGHPKVYYSFDGADIITCGYCDREFIRSA